MIFDEIFLKKLKSESYVSPSVERRDTPGKGVGLFAIKPIKKDEVVSISGGVIVEQGSETYNLLKSEYGDYAYSIHDQFIIVPLNPADPSDDWRMNHCCEPNCGVKGQIIFVALKDIEVNEELTFDYAMTESDPEYFIDLRCDKVTCRKRFSGNDYKRPELQKKYKGYFSNYIQEKINSQN